jgi:hypothetical protein
MIYRWCLAPAAFAFSGTGRDRSGLLRQWLSVREASG